MDTLAVTRALLLLTWTAHGWEITPPSWPRAYSYESTVRGFYDFEQTIKSYVSHSSDKLHVREDIDDGENSNFFLETETGPTLLSYFPTTDTENNEFNVINCVQELVGDEGPPVLPDLRHFEYVGNESLYGTETEKWWGASIAREQTIWIRYVREGNERYPVPVSSEVKVYGDSTNTKLADHQYIDYYNYEPKEPDSSVWAQPEDVVCTSALPTETTKNTRTRGHLLGKEELVMRSKLFFERKAFVDNHNQGNTKYKLKLNKFAHMTKAEMAQYRGSESQQMTTEGLKPFPYSDQQIADLVKDLPDSFDWRIHGAVTPVRSQGLCASCWAFSAVGALEGAYFLKSGRQDLQELSEQALVDCSWGTNNTGCRGGFPANAFKWVQDNDGIPTSASYGPYQAINGRCHLNGTTIVAQSMNFVKVAPTIDAMKVALVNHGPLSAGINSGDEDHPEFMFYGHGVLKPKNFSDDVNHGVLVVGYGDLDGEPYWLVKNSFGLEWGLDGYVLISAVNNTLNLLDYAVYAEL